MGDYAVNGPAIGDQEMSEILKGAALIGAAIIIAQGLAIYFSPFQTCMRVSHTSTPTAYQNAILHCK